MQILTYKIDITLDSGSLQTSIAHINVNSVGGKVFNNVTISVIGAVLKSDQIVNIDSSSTFIDVYKLESSAIYIKFSTDDDSVLMQDSSGVSYITINDPVTITKLVVADFLPLKQEYSPIHNFYNGTGSYNNDFNYTAPFISNKFGYTQKSELALRLQSTFDDSINMIFTDGETPIRLVNSRFILSGDYTKAKIADRLSNKDTNTYSDKYFYRTKLIPNYSGIAKLKFNGLETGGRLKPGSNRYYFRYVNANGAETDIIAESRNVSIHIGNDPTSSVGVKDNEFVNTSAKFILSNLDKSFVGIKVYYTNFNGEITVVPVSYKILKTYLIDDSGTCDIIHSGFEEEEIVLSNVISESYSKIGNGAAIEFSDNRLLIGNTNSKVVYDKNDAILSTGITIGESYYHLYQDTIINGIENRNQSNPVVEYEKTGYWPGETVELGIVYITDSGTTPVYPISGVDNIDGTENITDSILYNTDKFGIIDKVVDNTTGQNSFGSYRTFNDGKSFWEVSGGKIKLRGTKLKVNILPLLGYDSKIMSTYSNTSDRFMVLYNPADGLHDVIGTLDIDLNIGDSLTMRDNIALSQNAIIITTSYINKNNGHTINVSFSLTGKELVLNSAVDTSDGSSVTVGKNSKFHSTVIQPINAQILDKINGFFIVRKARKPDVVMEGISVPAATIPINTNSIADQACAITGNWIGVGTTTSAAKQGITRVPAPLEMMPFGSESIKTGKTHTISDGSGGTITVDDRSHTDFIVRAPIYDKNNIKSVAFYSPDIDTNPIQAGTYLYDSNITPVFYPVFPKASQHIVQGQPGYNKTSIDYISITGVDNTSDDKLVDKYGIAQYAEEGSLHGGKHGFSAISDRQVYMYLHDSIKQNPDLNYYTNSTAADNPFRNPDTNNVEPATIGVKPQDKVDGVASTDSDMVEELTPGSSVSYGSYVGINLSSYNSIFDTLYLTPSDSLKNMNYQTSLGASTSNGLNISDFRYGILTRIYPGYSNGPLDKNSWVEKYSYSDDSPYFAITDRIELTPDTDPNIDVFGGDCYIGIQWKQIWRPNGIKGVPIANDINAYLAQREALGLLDYGFAMPVPARASTNFFVRTPDNSNEVEWKILGEKRKYLPVISSIRGNRLPDSRVYNHGYSHNTYSANELFRLSINYPYILSNYPNRIYASAQIDHNSFINGAASFTGLDYRDYNFELGQITSINRLQDYIIIIFEGGIGYFSINERTAITQDGRVMMDSVSVLPKKIEVISGNTGSHYKHSVVVTNRHIYGIDLNKEVIWVVAPNKYSALTFQDISTLKVKTKLKEIKQEYNNAYDAINSAHKWKKLYVTFDNIKKDIYFTFVVYQLVQSNVYVMYSKALVYNVLLGTWITTTDDDKIFNSSYFSDRLYFSARNKNKLLKYQSKNNIGEYINFNNFGGTQYDAEVEIVAKPKSPGSKQFMNSIFMGYNVIPYELEFKTVDVEGKESIVPITNVAYEHPSVRVLSRSDRKIYVNTLPVIKWDNTYLSDGDLIQIKEQDQHTHETVFVDYIVKEVNTTDGYILVDKDTNNNTLVNSKLIVGFARDYNKSNAVIESNATKVVLKYTNESGYNTNLLIGTYLKMKAKFSGSSKIKLTYILTNESNIIS